MECQHFQIGTWTREALHIRGQEVIPSRTFKFLNSDGKFFLDATIELMLRNRVYLSSHLDFNDPYDSRMYVHIPSATELVNEWTKGFRERYPDKNIDSDYGRYMESPELFADKFRKSTGKTVANFGVYSLADTGRDPLMWAHYANGHKGIAFILRHAVAKVYADTLPIRYQETFPVVSADPGQVVLGALVKGKAWMYEGEWRIVMRERANTYHELPSEMLVGVVIGMRAGSGVIGLVESLLARRAALGLPGLHYYRAKQAESFEIAFERFGGAGWETAKWPLEEVSAHHGGP